jgi:hypothetical protein
VIGTGRGRTMNMSSGGVLFKTTDPVRIDMEIEVSIPWPARLNHRVGLQLKLKGRVIRVDGHLVAVRIRAYEFLTRLVSGPELVDQNP